MPDQPTEESPQQIVERELRAAQEQVRRVSDKLRADLAMQEQMQEQMQDQMQDQTRFGEAVASRNETKDER